MSLYLQTYGIRLATVVVSIDTWTRRERFGHQGNHRSTDAWIQNKRHGSMCTTGLRFFAECQLHSAKAVLYSVKPLTAKGSLPSVISRALGKGVAESNSTRQTCLGVADDDAFAECLTVGTQQRPKLCRVPWFGTPQSLSLCRVSSSWHSAKFW